MRFVEPITRKGDASYASVGLFLCVALSRFEMIGVHWIRRETLLDLVYFNHLHFGISMKKQLLSVTLLAAMTPFAAQAASVDLLVTGTVIPTSCVPSFNGGSTVDLGRIHSAALSPTAQNNLPARNVTLRIQCDAPAAVEVSVVDNRFATKAPGLIFNNQTSDANYYGLGNVQGVGIGGFALLANRAYAGGYPHELLVRSSLNPVWGVASNGLVLGAPLSYSWGVNATQGPVAVTQHALEMRVAAVIRPTSQLPAVTDEYKLDGSVTFEMKYL